MTDKIAMPFADLDPVELAEKVAAAMFKRDKAAQHLGIKVDKVGPGYSVLSMKVRDEMLNGHDIGHGGFIFALADTCFAYACNAYNFNTVASGCTIDYVAPAHLGDLLTATAEERALAGRTGVYDITVRNQKGDNVAHFRGKSYRIKGNVIQEE